MHFSSTLRLQVLESAKTCLEQDNCDLLRRVEEVGTESSFNAAQKENIENALNEKLVQKEGELRTMNGELSELRVLMKERDKQLIQLEALKKALALPVQVIFNWAQSMFICAVVFAIYRDSSSNYNRNQCSPNNSMI